MFQFNIYAQHKQVEKGIASYYHDHLKMHKTANGERYIPTEMTAAHLTLPFNTLVKVINLNNNKSILVRINDRGPFVENRIIDLSRAAADSIDMIFNGLAKVEINVITFGQRTKLSNVTAMASVEKLKSKKQRIKWVEKNGLDTISIVSENSNLNKTSQFPNQIEQKKKIENQDTVLATLNKISEENIIEIRIPEKKPKALEVQKTEVYTSTITSYGVQIGSFKKRSNMLKLSERLKKNFIDKFNIQEIYKGDTLFYRMIIGEFDNENSAIKLKSKLEKEFPGCFVIKYNN